MSMAISHFVFDFEPFFVLCTFSIFEMSYR